MSRPTARRAASATIVSLLLAPGAAAASGPGFMVLDAPLPRQVLAPGPGVWRDAPAAAGALELRDLASRLPRARLRVGRPALVRLPFAASAVTVTVLRPRAVLPGTTELVVTRTRVRARLVDDDTVAFRMSGTAGVVVVFAVDAAGRGVSSGRLLARLADAPSCRAWTRQLRRIDDPGTARADALRALLLRRCVSPFGLRAPRED
jgi:hypothetical protein